MARPAARTGRGRPAEPVAPAGAAAAAEPTGASRFPVHLLHTAATMYYLEDATQAQIAQRLGTSRPTVSRLLSEARRQGIVRIEVAPAPPGDDAELEHRVAEALGLDAVFLGTTFPAASVGPALAPALCRALSAVGLTPGEVLLVSSGRTLYQAARTRLPWLPGVRLAPMIGGQDEPEPWYQTNEITRVVAAGVGGLPSFLYAPALPGKQLHRSLLQEASIRSVLEMWQQARCAVMTIGGPASSRESMPRHLPADVERLHDAVGDVCSRFYDSDGHPLPFPGSERLMAIDLAALRRIPVGIALAAGPEKVAALLAGARSGLFTQLVTDRATALRLLALAVTAPAAGPS